MILRQRNILLPILGILMLFNFSCGALKTASFDQYAYEKAIEIKVDTNVLLEKSNESFSIYSDDVQTLKTDLKKIIEYEKNRDNNDISLKMWQLLANEEKNLLGGLLKRWERKEKLNPVFVKEAEQQIEQALDLIIRYEIRKGRENENNLQTFIEQL